MVTSLGLQYENLRAIHLHETTPITIIIISLLIRSYIIKGKTKYIVYLSVTLQLQLFYYYRYNYYFSWLFTAYCIADIPSTKISYFYSTLFIP